MLTKVHIVKAMVFPVVMNACEGWTLKKAEHWRNWCFSIVVQEKTLRVPWTARGSKPVHPKGNQSWISVGRTDAEAETPILWPPDVKRPWCWERLRKGEGDDRGWDGWAASWTQWTWIWADSGRQWRTDVPGMLHSMGSQRVRHDLATEQWQQGLLRISCSQKQD